MQFPLTKLEVEEPYLRIHMKIAQTLALVALVYGQCYWLLWGGGE